MNHLNSDCAHQIGDFNRINVIATTKGTFAGAATIKSRFLSRLHDLGFSVTFVGENVPPALATMSADVPNRVIDTGQIRSASANGLELLQPFLVGALIDECVRQQRKGYRTILWGSHLFPYGAACVHAKRILIKRGVPVSLIIFPVGADIWEIGSVIPTVTEDLLTAPEIDVIATYSAPFSKEILQMRGTPLFPVQIVPPFLPAGQFQPLVDNDVRTQRRQRIGIPSNAVVFINHSNMRPIKRVDFSIELVDRIAECISDRPTFLILLGPQNHELPHARHARMVRLETMQNVADWLAICDYAINTSLHDSFNTALLEAMACGVIPVTSDRPAIATIITEAKAGIVFETTRGHAPLSDEMSGEYPVAPAVVESIVTKIANLSRVSADAYRQNAQTLVREKFSVDVGTQSLLALIADALRE